MKKIKKLISVLILGVVSFGVVGCNNTPQEEAFTTLPEDNIVTESYKDTIMNHATYEKDLELLGDFFVNGKEKADKDFVKKHKLNELKNHRDVVELSEKSPYLFNLYVTNISITTYLSNNKYGDLLKAITDTGINYVNDIWLGEKEGEYKLTKEFAEQNPSKVFKDYLKANNIKDLIIEEYPEKYIRIAPFGQEYVFTMPFEISGKQDKSDFNKVIFVDFFIRASESNRAEKDLKLTYEDWEISKVGMYTDTNKEDINIAVPFDFEKEKKDLNL